MSSEWISSMIKSLISCTDETTSFYYIMSVIKSWSCKVLIKRVNLEAFKGVDRIDSMLPDIANNIKETICFKHVNRVWRQPILQVDVSNLLGLPIIEVLLQRTSHGIILILSGQSNRFACLLPFPLTEGLSLQVVNFNRPVPWHLDKLSNRSQHVLRFLSTLPCDLPENRFVYLCWLQPMPAFLTPVLTLRIPSLLVKFKELSIRNQHLTCWVLLRLNCSISELIVPTVCICGLFLPVPFLLKLFYRFH